MKTEWKSSLSEGHRQNGTVSQDQVERRPMNKLTATQLKLVPTVSIDFMLRRCCTMARRMSWLVTSCFCVTISLVTTGAGAPGNVSGCDLMPTFMFHHSDRQENFNVQVYEAKRAGTAMAFWAPRFAVNTDGTPKSYSLDDPDGATFALNSLRHGFMKKCLYAFDAIVNRLPDLRDQGWPKDADNKLIDKHVIDCLSPWVFPRAAGGEPCPEIRLEGHRFLVSATALFNNESDVCNPSKYVDSRRLAAVVLPRDKRFNGLVGKYALAWHPDRRALVLGVVGDRGPQDKMGEGSIALNAGLLGLSTTPRTYPEVKRMLHIGTPVFVMVLREVDGKESAFKSRDDFEADAQAAWRRWVGSSGALPDVVSACAQAASRPK